MRVIQICLFLTLFTFSNLAFSQDFKYVKLSEEELPTNIEIGFYKKFQNAKNVKWFVADVGNQEFYKGEFPKDGQSIALVFDENANAVRQVITSKKNDIPTEIVEYFAATNKDYRLIRLSQILMNDALNAESTYFYYKLMVKAGDREIAFQFDSDHELFKGKQYFEDVNYLR